MESHYAGAWNGGVRTQYEGITPLDVPMPTNNPADIVGTGAGSMYQQAGLKIIDGVGYDEAGNNLNWCSKNTGYKKGGVLIIDPGCNSTNNYNPVVKAGAVYDYREGKTMNTLDIDMNALATYAPAKNALVTPPAGDDPGILYVSTSGTNGAVRLVNGSTLPQNQVNGQAAGLTVATPNPVYVKGDYNSRIHGAGGDHLRCPHDPLQQLERRLYVGHRDRRAAGIADHGKRGGHVGQH